MIKNFKRPFLVAFALLLSASFLSASTSAKKHSASARLSPDGATPATCVGGPTLSGWYGFMVSGGVTFGGNKYLSGAILLDGNCGLAGSNVNGGTNGQYVNTSVTGSYGRNSDNTFTITMNLAGQPTPQTYVVGVSESGNKARGIESDNSAAANIDMQSQLTSLTSGYSTSSLNGSYAASCTGIGVEFNYITFDGNGHVTGLNDYDTRGGGQGTNPLNGTYTVNGDGTFTGTLTGSYGFRGVIETGISQIHYVYNNSGSGGVFACTGKQAAAGPPNLVGHYGFVVGGTQQTSSAGAFLSGSINFDGAGGFTGVNVNGDINHAYGHTSVAGTYTPNTDNTISLTMNLTGQAAPKTFIIALSESGNEGVGIETDGNAVATIDLQNQLWPSATPPYSLASLNGPYAASCAGDEVDTNYVTFDGNGNLFGVDPYDNGTFGSNPYTGFYAVNSDGTFSGGFFDKYTAYTMTGVIDNVTGEIEYTYDYANEGVVSCIGESGYGPIGPNPVAATPTFSPAPGAYGSAQSVTLSDTNVGATIYYTTDGTPPSTGSAVYSGPVAVNATTTIQAIAVATGYNNSAIGAGTFFLTAGGNPTAATPTFNPAPGSFNSPQQIALNDTTAGAVIYYTTDGSTPTTSSSVYGSAIPVNTTTTIKAVAVASGYNNSSVANGTFTITLPTAATPTFSPVAGTFNAPQSVTLSDSTAGAVIYCTTDGSTPTTGSPVCTTVQVNTTTTIQAIAVATNFNNSAVATGIFTITLPTAATPTFTPAPGTYSSPQSVTLSDTTPAAVIYYTTNGTTPTTSSSVYSSAIAVNTTTTIQAIAVATNFNNSAVASGTYTITPTAATPTFTPAPGSYNSPQSVTLNDTTAGAVIYYTTNGTTPTTSSSAYSSPIAVNTTTTIQAIAVATNFNNSAVASGTYTITLPTAATPTFTPAPGSYNSPQSVTLNDTTAQAVIYYTTNGTTPTTSSSVYSSPIAVNTTTTIQAIAVATNFNNSAVASGTFTISQSQTITFPAIPNQTYGASPITLNATSTSNLPVSYSVLTGPASVSGNVLTITGAGSVTVQATQAGNAQFAAAAPVSQSFSVVQANTSLTLISSVNPSALGQLVAFTASITPQFGGQATGSVTFKDGSAVLAIISVSGNVATLSTSALAVGAHSISAVYSGDSNVTGSVASPLSQTVQAAATSTSLASSVNPSVAGKAVTFSATVAAVSGTPTGSVQFFSNGALLGSAALNSGIAKYTTTKLPAGSNTITAVYVGNGNNSTSTSAPLTQSVMAVTTTVIASSVNPSAFGQPVTFTATVNSSVGAPPDGETVTFIQGAVTVGTGVLSGGSATFTTSALAVGNKPMKATYGGDAGLVKSTSAIVNQVIAKAPSTVALGSSLNPSLFGQSVTFTATVTGQFGGTPTGNVVFKDGATILKTVTLSGATASFATTKLAKGTHNISVTYNGSVSFTTGTTSLSQTVN